MSEINGPAELPVYSIAEAFVKRPGMYIGQPVTFEDEIAREVRQGKFTFAELEEEEQSLDRLRRWYRDLKRRDILVLPDAEDAAARLRECERSLDGYAEQVYAANRGTTTGQA
jgi:hypothetical protein